MVANLIYVHPSGGKLYQGGYREVSGAVQANPIKTIVFAAEELPIIQIQDVESIPVPLDDNFQPSWQEYAEILTKARNASKVVANKVSQGQEVLVSCAAGWNRSGLINGFSLRRLTGCSGLQAIQHIQTHRKNALGNPAFRHMICLL